MPPPTPVKRTVPDVYSALDAEMPEMAVCVSGAAVLPEIVTALPACDKVIPLPPASVQVPVDMSASAPAVLPSSVTECAPSAPGAAIVKLLAAVSQVGTSPMSMPVSSTSRRSRSRRKMRNADI